MSPDDDPTATQLQQCAPCRGTGSLISNLGGEQSQVPCSWCEGTGTVIPEHDAQAARKEQAAAG